MLGDVVELKEPTTRVIKDPIENHSYAMLLRPGKHGIERFVSAEHRIDSEVVVRVIPMIRRALKDGVEPQGRYPEVGEITELVGDAP